MAQLLKDTGVRLVRPKDKINAWLNVLERSYGNEDKINSIKSFYLQTNVLKTKDIPESFFTNYMARAKREGRTKEINLSKYQREQLAANITRDQSSSLGEWLDFFFSEDSSVYPMWVKYWALSSVVNMGRFSHENGTYSKRAADQIAPFPELNMEAFAIVVDAVLKKLNQESLADIKDKKLLERLEGLSFAKLYGHEMTLFSGRYSKNMKVTEGEWVKFSRGSDHNLLYKALQGRSTGWCTAGKATAEAMLEAGDFHVYFTKDQDNQFTIPRIAIRFIGDEMSEVRGIYEDQNIDPYLSITPILADRLQQFPPTEKNANFTKAEADIRRLSQILQDSIDEKEVSLEDLRFMYEIDRKIEGLGHKPDPRINEFIRYSRDIKFDLVMLFNYRYTQDQISLTKEEAVAKKSRLHYGDLDYLTETTLENVHVPEVVLGELNLSKLNSGQGLILPKLVTQSIRLDNITSILGVKRWPDDVYRNVFINKVAFFDTYAKDSMPANIFAKVQMIGPLEHVIGFRRNAFDPSHPFVSIPLPP